MTHSTASATTAGGMGTWPVTVGPGTTGASMEGATAAESEGTWPETATKDNKEQHQSPSNKIPPMSTAPNPQHTN